MINILGINISTLNKKQILEKIGLFLSDDKQHQIVTPNPEFLLQTQKDEEFFYILNTADLAIPDGVGLKFAALAMGKNIHRFAGADLVKDILRRQTTDGRQQRIAVVNWKGGLSKKEDIEKVLWERYQIKNSFVVDVDKKIGNWKLPARRALAGGEIGNLFDYQPDILFVALGAPWQEKFIYHNLPELPSVKLAIGVGGAFDFLTGKIKRAPKILRILGLEWLWRIFNQPAGKRLWRIKKIYNAVIIFPWEFFKWRFVNPFLYRPNVACLLYKSENDKYKILLVERKNEAGHWQLPQGGTDGENLKIAGTRELTEEIGTNKFHPIKSFSDVYQYKFGDKKSRAGIKSKYIEGYKGQKQELFIAKFIGEESDIKINFWDHSAWKWVDSENLIDEAHLNRKEAAKIFLEKFNKTIKYEVQN